ncbi:MAG: hypothetical protein SVK44_02055 [Nitrospirota bacterium]|nr:hypothetical protein [Nitrospirota bacterium]
MDCEDAVFHDTINARLFILDRKAMAYAFLRSVRSRLLMAFLLTAVFPLLLLSILFYTGFKEEMQAVQTDTRRQVWDSLTERAHESVGSAQRLAQTKLLYWRERLEAIASLASTICLHPENYKRGPLLWSPLGFFFSSMEGKANVGLIYSQSSKNILSLSHFSRFSYVAPLLASVYEGGDIQNVWIVLKNRAYIIYPGINHERPWFLQPTCPKIWVTSKSPLGLPCGFEFL